MKNTFLTIFLILSIFFFANQAISIIIADQDKKLIEEMSGDGQDDYKDPLKKPLNLGKQEQKDLFRLRRTKPVKCHKRHNRNLCKATQFY